MNSLPAASRRPVVARLAEPRPLVAVELRPPQSGLPDREGMDAWIDMYHSVRRLLRRDSMVFLTDNAVGESEEENLRHLVSNLSSELSPDRIVPFLTSKHSLDYCLMYAARAAAHGFQALTVLGGDRIVGPPRCVSYASELRKLVRDRHPDLALGGWANPYRDAAEQVEYLLRPEYTAEFYLTQIVSHHDLPRVERFVVEARRRGVTVPGVFGVFFYRSGNPRTLEKLGRFFSVPVEPLTREFAAGLSPEDICVRTITALRSVGVDKVYVSNLGFREPEKRYRSLMDALGE